jgi:hypothetical protein
VAKGVEQTGFRARLSLWLLSSMGVLFLADYLVPNGISVFLGAAAGAAGCFIASSVSSRIRNGEDA